MVDKNVAFCGEGHLTIRYYKNSGKEQVFSAGTEVNASGYSGSKGRNHAPSVETQES